MVQGFFYALPTIAQGFYFLPAPGTGAQPVEKVDRLPERAKKSKSKACQNPVIEAYIRYAD